MEVEENFGRRRSTAGLRLKALAAATSVGPAACPRGGDEHAVAAGTAPQGPRSRERPAGQERQPRGRTRAIARSSPVPTDTRQIDHEAAAARAARHAPAHSARPGSPGTVTGSPFAGQAERHDRARRRADVCERVVEGSVLARQPRLRRRARARGAALTDRMPASSQRGAPSAASDATRKAAAGWRSVSRSAVQPVMPARDVPPPGRRRPPSARLIGLAPFGHRVHRATAKQTRTPIIPHDRAGLSAQRPLVALPQCHEGTIQILSNGRRRAGLQLGRVADGGRTSRG
jgi:hypothetical protein